MSLGLLIVISGTLIVHLCQKTGTLIMLWFIRPPPHLRTILLNKAYVVIWTFGKPPPPALSTWFMNDLYVAVSSMVLYLYLTVPAVLDFRKLHRISCASIVQSSKMASIKVTKVCKVDRIPKI